MPNPSDLQQRIDLENKQEGPASPELCAALGLNPDDLADALQPEGRPKRPPTMVQPQRQSQVSKEMLARASEALSKEATATKEAVITTVATYIANKDDKWWQQPSTFREKEVYFLVKMLVHTYNELEER